MIPNARRSCVGKALPGKVSCRNRGVVVLIIQPREKNVVVRQIEIKARDIRVLLDRCAGIEAKAARI